MTEKIFYEDPYKKEIDSIIVDIVDNKVILDKTIFYPQAAGEPGDTGFIENYKVIDTQKQGDTIFHILEQKPNLKKGQKVKCRINWERRYRLMKMHTTSHLLLNVCQLIFGKNIRVTGSNIDEHKSRIDLDYKPIIDQEKRQELENKCNEFIKKNLEMKIWWDPERIGYRWTKIDDLNQIPCGGLHIKNLGEIKKFRIIRRLSKGKGKQRLEFEAI